MRIFFLGRMKGVSTESIATMVRISSGERRREEGREGGRVNKKELEGKDERREGRREGGREGGRAYLYKRAQSW